MLSYLTLQSVCANQQDRGSQFLLGAARSFLPSTPSMFMGSLYNVKCAFNMYPCREKLQLPGIADHNAVVYALNGFAPGEVGRLAPAVSTPAPEARAGRVVAARSGLLLLPHQVQNPMYR